MCQTSCAHRLLEEWDVFQGVAPSAWRSRAHRSVRTTTPSSYSVGLCTDRRGGRRECGRSVAAGSSGSRAAWPGSEEARNSGLQGQRGDEDVV